jgi:predicted alpha/beta superfamily hydrolase
LVKVRLTSLCLLAGLLAACGGPQFTGTAEQFTLESDQVGDEFVIDVYLPPGFDDDAAALPTAYVFDGNSLGDPTAAIAEDAGRELLVVAIGYTDGFPGERRRDFTPTEDTQFDVETGRVEEFFAFIRTELVPEIESRYAVTDERALLGHSLGGMAALWMAMHQEPTDEVYFEHVIAASPAMWWDSGVMLEIEDDYAADHDALEANVFVRVGDIETVAIIGYIEELMTRVESRDYDGLDLDFGHYENMVHNVSWEPTYADGLEALDVGG